jgi:hypothetical protein
LNLAPFPITFRHDRPYIKKKYRSVLTVPDQDKEDWSAFHVDFAQEGYRGNERA